LFSTVIAQLAATARNASRKLQRIEAIVPAADIRVEQRARLAKITVETYKPFIPALQWIGISLSPNFSKVSYLRTVEIQGGNVAMDPRVELPQAPRLSRVRMEAMPSRVNRVCANVLLESRTTFLATDW
jgi:hypothetical protein